MKLPTYKPTFLFIVSQSDLNIQEHSSRQYMPRKMQRINYRDCNRGASGWLALGPDPLCSLGQVWYSPFTFTSKILTLLTSQGLNDRPGTTPHGLIASFCFWAGSWACCSPSTSKSSGQSVQKQPGRSPSLAGRCLRGNEGEDFMGRASTAAVGVTSRLNIITSFHA